MKIIAILVGIASIFYACRKDAEVTKAAMTSMNSNIAEPVLQSITMVPSNPENRYDSIGIWHNEILDFIDANRTDKSSPLSEPEISGLVNEFALTRWGYQLPELPISTTNWRDTDGIQAYLDELVSRSTLSDYGRQYFIDLLLVVKEQVSQPDFSYARFKGIVKEMEMQFKADELLANDDRLKLQMAASVARYSTWYWTIGISDDPDIQPQPVEGGDTARITLKGIIRAVATISADIGGAASGYVGGSLRGAAGKAAGDSEWMSNYISYGIPGN